MIVPNNLLKNRSFYRMTKGFLGNSVYRMFTAEIHFRKVTFLLFNWACCFFLDNVFGTFETYSKEMYEN